MFCEQAWVRVCQFESIIHVPCRMRWWIENDSTIQNSFVVRSPLYVFILAYFCFALSLPMPKMANARKNVDGINIVLAFAKQNIRLANVRSIILISNWMKLWKAAAANGSSSGNCQSIWTTRDLSWFWVYTCCVIHKRRISFLHLISAFFNLFFSLNVPVYLCVWMRFNLRIYAN